MRLGIVLAALLLAAPGFATAEAQREPRDLLALTVVRVGDADVFLQWTVAPAAYSYKVYRGTDLNELEFIGSSFTTLFHDDDAPDADVWYVVLSEGQQNTLDDLKGPMRGRCVSSRGGAGLSVTFAHCTPQEVGS